MNDEIDKIIRNALAEDIGSKDITTFATIDPKAKAKGKFLVKENGVLAGIDIAKKVFELQDQLLDFEILINNGEKVASGNIVAVVIGTASSILIAERTALNFLQRMSGIATLTSKFVEQVKHTKARIIDTRKTAPGLRLLDKMAVKIGGGENHRFGLYDMFLIKDNHIEIAGSIAKAVESCKSYNNKAGSVLKLKSKQKILMKLKKQLTAMSI